jgi:hypothetical protein
MLRDPLNASQDMAGICYLTTSFDIFPLPLFVFNFSIL